MLAKWKLNKKQLTIIAALFITAMIFFVLPDVSFAAGHGVPNSTSDIASQDLNNTVGGIIRKIVNFAAVIAGVIFVGFLIRDGIKLAGSGGNPQARAEAIRGIVYSLLGCLCSIGASVLVGVVIGLI